LLRVLLKRHALGLGNRTPSRGRIGRARNQRVTATLIAASQRIVKTSVSALRKRQKRFASKIWHYPQDSAYLLRSSFAAIVWLFCGRLALDRL